MIVSILFILLGIVMQTGISLYVETKTFALDMLEEQEWDAVKEFNRRKRMSEITQK